MSEHTPGPWHLMNLSTDRGTELVVYAPEDVQVIRTQHEANARLIAAGPELLQAAKLASVMMREMMKTPNLKPYACLEQIEEAIAKAEPLMHTPLNAASGITHSLESVLRHRRTKCADSVAHYREKAEALVPAKGSYEKRQQRTYLMAAQDYDLQRQVLDQVIAEWERGHEAS